MHRFARLAVAAALVLGLAAGPASASGGLWCTTDDSSAKFQLDAGLTRGSGALFNFRGDLAVRSPDAPAGFRDFTLAGDDLIQWWLDDKELKLGIYRERQDPPYGILTLTIETKEVDEDVYEGAYELTIAAPKDGVQTTVVDVRGKTSCGAE